MTAAGNEHEHDLDAGLLAAARMGDLDALTQVCGHYRERLITFAANAGATEPNTVAESAVTRSLLSIDPGDLPTIDDFETDLFAEAMAALVPGEGA